MPYTEGNIGMEESAGVRSSANKGSIKKLTKQFSTIDSDDKRQMLKQESKDSGIVTEMTIKHKDISAGSGRSQKEYTRSATVACASSKTKRNLRPKNQSDKIKRSQSVKVKGNQKEQLPDGSREVSHDDLEIELLTPKHNGLVDDDQDKKNPSTIRGMWKKAFKTLKSSSSLEKLSKKSGSFHKKKQNSKEADEEVELVNAGPVDPVYSLLKCAADLPRAGGRSPCLIHPHCSGLHTPGYSRYHSGGDSSESTSKASSPSSSASHSPKTRRKKMNARMKSFSLDAPEPPKHLLGIDETTKQKSSSFTNTCFGVASGKESPDQDHFTSFSAVGLRKKFLFLKASSLDIEDKKNLSHTSSPKGSPKSLRKETKNVYVALYNFKAKEKDDIDLRAGWQITVTDCSKKDWWKGKTHGKSGYFPATYIIPLQPDQRVFQVLQPLNLSDGTYTIKFHKDQIVLQAGEEVDGMILIRAANNRQAVCPLIYLQEL